jgi:phasin family protein
MADEPKTFNPFDISKLTTDFDPSKMMDKITKVFTDYKIPGVDMSSVLEHQRKNVEALTASNKKAIEGLQSVATRQSQILKETMDEAVGALKALTTSGGPKELAAKQAELLKSALEKALSNMRELAEMAAKSNTESFEVIRNRFTASISEIKDMAKSITNKGADKGAE